MFCSWQNNLLQGLLGSKGGKVVEKVEQAKQGADFFWVDEPSLGCGEAPIQVHNDFLSSQQLNIETKNQARKEPQSTNTLL